MMVKYITERGYKGEDKDPYLTLGKEYIIVTLIYNSYSKTHEVGIFGDDKSDPTVIDADLVNFTNENIPADWIFEKLESGRILIGPKEFGGDFWDKFYDGLEEEKYEGIYRDVINKICAFHGLDPFYEIEPPKKEPLKEHDWWKEYDEEGNISSQKEEE